jgi:hypothetical protein
MTQRRAIYQIQTELKLISQKCQFKRDWVNDCIVFFSQRQGQIKHIPYSYKVFSLGLLYYVIRNIDNSVLLDFYLRNVARKCAAAKTHKITRVYNNLVRLFGQPKKLDYKVIPMQIIEHLKVKYPDLKDILESQENDVSYSPYAMSARELSQSLYSYLKKYKTYQKKDIFEMIKKAFVDIQIL